MGENGLLENHYVLMKWYDLMMAEGIGPDIQSLCYLVLDQLFVQLTLYDVLSQIEFTVILYCFPLDSLLGVFFINWTSTSIASVALNWLKCFKFADLTCLSLPVIWTTSQPVKTVE